MKKYDIYETTDREYNGFLLCLTCDSLLDYLSSIENEPLVSHSDGTLLIDQLLVTGNGNNRYISCPFNNGKISMSSIKSVSPNQYYRELSCDLLQKNYPLLKSSILTDAQRAKIRRGIPV